MNDWRSGLRRLARIGAIAGIGAGAASGCGQNSCDRAAEHEIDCKVVGQSTNSSSSGGAAIPTDCSGVAQCEATCLANAPCSELQDFNDPTKAKTLKRCLEKCVKPPSPTPAALESESSESHAD